MPMEFLEPDFKAKCLELRMQDQEVCIYASREGLRRLVAICQGLLERGDGHVHLEDLDMLTEESLKGVIALFRN